MNTDARIHDLALAMDLLIAETGPQALTMRKIARASGWSTSALSERFGTRNHLLRLCLRTSAGARLAETQWRVAAQGLVGLLPAPEGAHEAARAWAGWVSIGHFEPHLELTLLEAECEELNLITQTLVSRTADAPASTALGGQQPGNDARGQEAWSRPPAQAVKALLDGLRWRMAMPGTHRRMWADADPRALAMTHSEAASQLLDGISNLVVNTRAA